MHRTLKEYLVIGLKGMAMGAADVVPGVSGGTIALITGIYQELIQTISAIDLSLFSIWKKQGFKAMFNAVNGKFLLFLIGGILISVFSLAKLFHYLLEHQPVLVWAFFFGLIVASVWLVGKMVQAWNVKTTLALIIGIVISYGITLISPAQGPDAFWYLFISGMLAFIAMILPGISGSFILLLLGAYQLVLGKVSGLIDGISQTNPALIGASILALGVFVLGGVTGLLSFSKVLKYMFKKYEALTLALLTGFLIGSLNKVWPWKTTSEVLVKHLGTPKEEIIPLIQTNVWPWDYSLVSSADQQLGLFEKDPQLGFVLALGALGFIMIFAIERLASRLSAS